MTDAQATAVLQAQLVDGEGFLAVLARSGHLDNSGVQQTERALEELGRAWAGRYDVSKKIARYLVDVTGILHACAERYPDLSDELWTIADRFDQLMTRLFSTKQMSESEAAAIVYGHLNGLSSIANILHFHEPIVDTTWSDDLGTAIDTLALAWKGHDTVPKAIARPMLTVSDLVVGHAAAYPDKESELLSVAADLVGRVKKCFR